jgi:hypothetical protein
MSPRSKQGPGTGRGPCLLLITNERETIMNLYSVLAAYALMDPSRVPGPASLALIVVGLSLLGFSVGKGWRRGR